MVLQIYKSDAHLPRTKFRWLFPAPVRGTPYNDYIYLSVSMKLVRLSVNAWAATIKQIPGKRLDDVFTD